MTNSDDGHENAIEGLTRRRLVQATGLGALAFAAGCTGGGGGDTETPGAGTPTEGMGTATPEAGTPTATPAVISPAPNDNEVHFLTDYSNDAWQGIWENEIIPKFEEKTGIPLNIEYTGFQGTGEQRLTTLLQAGNPPESFTGGLGQSADLLANGDLVPTTETVDYLAERNSGLVAKPDRIRGEYWLVPHGLYLFPMNYRTDIADQLSLDPPETWSTLRENAQAIGEDSSIEAKGFAVAAQKTGQSGSQFVAFLRGAGATRFRWKSDDMKEAEVWFPEDEAIEVLELQKQLAEYSPDPSSLSWGPSLKFWVGGRIAQMWHANGWSAGIAARAGNAKVARNTDIAYPPAKDGVDPVARMTLKSVDGHPVIDGDNPGGAKKLLRFMYEDPQRAAQYYTGEPTRFLPAYSDVYETDTYQNAKIFKEFPNLREINLKLRDEYAPKQITAEQEVVTMATLYASRFPIESEMMNQVIVAGRPPKPAVREAIDRVEKRLEEGKKKAGK